MQTKPNCRDFCELLINKTKTPKSKFSGGSIGVIKSLSPLVINIDGNDIPEQFLYLSPFCKEFKTQIFKHKHKYNVSHNHKYDDHDTGEGSGGSRSNVDTTTEMTEDRETMEELLEVVVWRGIGVGDKVLCLRTGESQQYIVLWRDTKLDNRGV